jgi:hypothetical protein
LVVKGKIFVFLCIGLLTVLLAVFSTNLLPDKYFFDAILIITDPHGQRALIGSYPFSMLFYHFSGLGKLPFTAIALIQLPIVFLAVSRLGIPAIFSKPYLRNLIIWITMLLFGVYLAIPSKEFINLLYVCLIGYVLVSRIRLPLKVLGAVALFAFFGLWFRPYYFLVPLFAFVLYLLSHIKIRNRVFFNLVMGLVVASFFSLAFGVVKGEFMTAYFRERINEVRIGREDSQTIITSPMTPDSPVGEGVSIVYGFFSVNVPFNGLRFLNKPQVLAFVGWQLILFVYMMWFYNRCLQSRRVYRHEEWVFHFLFSYLIIQGIFEPDLGSAVKHKLGVFPLIYLAMYYDQGLIKKIQKSRNYVFGKDWTR